jgi:hypothetical protein
MLLASAFAGGGGCAEDGVDKGPGVRLEVLAPAESARRPDAIYYYWLSPSGVLLEGRLPEDGMLDRRGPVVATLFINTRVPLAEPRALVVRGEQAGAVVAGGALRIDPTGARQLQRQLSLGPPLPDDDADRIPDQVERNCLVPGGPTCPTPPPPDAGAPDAADAGADGPTGDAADAAGEADRPDGSAPPDAAPDSRPDLASDGAPDAGNPALAVGLVGHWRFDDGMGTVARDSSTNQNNGTLIGISATTGWVTGRVGGALEIPAADGNGVVVLPSASIETIARSFTIAAWTYRTANRPTNGGLSNVVSRRATGSADKEYFALAFIPEGRLRGFINTQLSNQPAVSSANPLPLNQWVHVAYVYNAAQLIIYVNGTQTGTTSYTQPVGMASMPLCLGCGQNQSNNGQVPDESLGGRLDELLIYNRALPADELAMLAAGAVPPPP